MRDSQEEAYEKGIQGVFFYALDGGRAVSGTQPVEVVLRTLDVVRTGHAG